VLICSIIPAVLMGWVGNYEALLLCGFFIGIALASFSVGVGFVSGWYPPGRQGYALGVYDAGNIGQSLAAFGTPVVVSLLGVQAIGRALETPEARHALGMAIFAALQRGFFQSDALDVPVENELVVHETPYLVPLLQALCRQREYLMVLTDTHRGRLYAATPGGVRLLQEIEEEVPSRQHSAEECWGKEQATIARHREDRILHYQKERNGFWRTSSSASGRVTEWPPGLAK
jgi:hypothetical protein